MQFDIGINEGIIISGHDNYKPLEASIGIKDGKIVWIGKEPIAKTNAKEILSAKDKIIMPGLYNCHCHGDMTLARGLGDDMTLLEQIEAFKASNWFYEFITEEDRLLSRKLTYAEAILSGCVFLLENMYWGLEERSLEPMMEVGIKGALAEDIRYDFAKPDNFLDDRQLLNLKAKCIEHGIIPVIGTISEEDFEAERLIRAAETINRIGVYETRHLAENTWRVDRIMDKFNTTPVSYLEQINVLHNKMLGSHAIYISEDEIKIMAARGVSVANTPLCEMKISDGIAPIPLFLKHGVNVCLGTDGAMWNNSNDIFREMKGMVLLHNVNSGIRAITAKDALDMATVNGAKAFGLEKERGTIEEGKFADIILIDTKKPHLRPIRKTHMENIASTVVYNATGSDVSDVIIEGRHLVKDGKLVTVDVNHLMEEIDKISERIGEAYEQSEKINKTQ